MGMMNYRKLGNTDISVSALSMGCWAIASDPMWGPQDEAESAATIHAALDIGVNFFDTAEGYTGGESEAVLGRSLVGRRQEAVIATKASRTNLSGDEVAQACESSLRRLQTDYIDLYQIHWPSRTVPLEETMEALERLCEQGKVRAIGICNFGVGDLSDLLEIGQVQSNHLPYSLLWRAIEYEIQQACVDENLGMLCYSPLAQGLLAGKFATPDDVPEGRARIRLFSNDRPMARHGDSGCETEVFAALDKIRPICVELDQQMAQVALGWVLHQPGVTSVIAGARTPEQIRRNAEAADLALSPETLAQLAEATKEVKDCIGPNPDLWQSVSRFR
jgi:aryl-alcohol dehydrogenase-like predicted oxidoreductase